MKVLVCGGRDYTNKRQLYRVLDDLAQTVDIDTIIEGGARGADQLARQYAADGEIPVKTYPADWDQYGKAAGAIRNRQMLREGHPDLVIAFPGGRGTANMVEIARRAGVNVIEVSDAE